MHAGRCQRVADGDQRETPVSWRLSHSVIDSVGLAAPSSRRTPIIRSCVRLFLAAWLSTYQGVLGR